MNREVAGFRIEKPLGKGGMGQVFLARHPRTGARVALKVVHAALRDRPEVRSRFDREARAMAKVEHPNVIRILDAGDSDGTLYLAMEFVEGEDLVSRVEKRGPLAPAEATSLAQDLLSGLAALHQAGVLHRDLKPANVMIDRSGRAILLDLGLCRAEDAATLTTSGMAVGTPLYMAPEVLSRSEGDVRSDLYQAGLVLWEAAAGRLAFDTRDLQELTRRILARDFPSLARLRPDLDPGFLGLVEDLTALAPEARPASAQTALAVLASSRGAPAEIRMETSLPVEPTRTPGMQASPAARSRGRAARPGLPVFLALVVLAALVWPTGREPTGEPESPASAPDPADPDSIEAESAPRGGPRFRLVGFRRGQGVAFRSELPAEVLVTVEYPTRTGRRTVRSDPASHPLVPLPELVGDEAQGAVAIRYQQPGGTPVRIEVRAGELLQSELLPFLEAFPASGLRPLLRDLGRISIADLMGRLTGEANIPDPDPISISDQMEKYADRARPEVAEKSRERIEAAGLPAALREIVPLARLALRAPTPVDVLAPLAESLTMAWRIERALLLAGDQLCPGPSAAFPVAEPGPAPDGLRILRERTRLLPSTRHPIHIPALETTERIVRELPAPPERVREGEIQIRVTNLHRSLVLFVSGSEGTAVPLMPPERVRRYTGWLAARVPAGLLAGTPPVLTLTMDDLYGTESIRDAVVEEIAWRWVPEGEPARFPFPVCPESGDP